MNLEFTLNDRNCIEYRDNGHQIGIGAVAYIKYVGNLPEYQNKFVAVTKSERNYCSGKMIFPGGMARVENAQDLEKIVSWEDLYPIVKSSLLKRLKLETGLEEKDFISIKKLSNYYDVPTKYETPVDGKKRITKILAYEIETTNHKLIDMDDDDTVTDPIWLGFDDLKSHLNWARPNLYLLKLLMAKENYDVDLPEIVIKAMEKAETSFVAPLKQNIMKVR
ncbi:hypothetical protein HOD20_00150 [archaeon]|jgi:hypothetical protein|nr:hypothetical protein [archaeon]MBT4350913.1 hypothetical protein [archaeon]MBT4646955.1 hypothetical protein [archaeon]MBT6821679.1 hypothetical protein [archaeon]MBT7392210.1 hypothetical protein [archaeon]